jgi:hypothetical protein
MDTPQVEESYLARAGKLNFVIRSIDVVHVEHSGAWLSRHLDVDRIER